MTEFVSWFGRVVGSAPHPWQGSLGSDPRFHSRLIRIPTGFGKTLGALLSWLFNRVTRGDDGWPRRLFWCLPKPVLVEQTHAEAEQVLGRLGILWDGKGDHVGRVGLHLLMGGSDAGEWHLWPEECAILIGTQDMLLSRALNRGYGAARARWPMEFGLLNHDCLWVMDEVQLMDVGLVTSAQLQAFRAGTPESRPTGTWWMSATLQSAWLATRDTGALVESLPRMAIDSGQRRGPLWTEVQKPCTVVTDTASPKQLAKLVADEHARSGSGANGPTLVVVNTVDRAIEVATVLRGARSLSKTTDVRLVHSRFRAAERSAWRDAFLNRGACTPGTDRIIVATQVVEAGVDISASLLITDLAPWPSLVQRFGRSARWGGTARVLVVDNNPKDDKAALPYAKVELDAARDALAKLTDVAPLSLERFEENLDSGEVERLYPYEFDHLLLRHEIDELFDTTPDLTGADVDVSRFIRSGEERDVRIFWVPLAPQALPDPNVRPVRQALCAVPFLKAREWLCGKKRALLKRRSAWVWDWLEGRWREASAADIYPGQTLLVDASYGGYDWDATSGWGVGWSPGHQGHVPIVPATEAPSDERADSMQDDESLSESPYRTIATHGTEAGALAQALARTLSPLDAPLLRLAGLWHDVGKAHPAFQGSIHAEDRPVRSDLAKAPASAWPRSKRYVSADGSRRPGFRHELASSLALFGVLRRHAPAHDALLGKWTPLLEAMGRSANVDDPSGRAPVAVERDLVALSAAEFDLLAYLVASHHGKVRASLHAAPSDQEAMASSGELTIRGIRTGDELPALRLGDSGELLPATSLDLSVASMGISAVTGASWSDRVLSLIAAHGPFRLAWLEALLRAADQRASRIVTTDPVLGGSEP